ncbi:D-arabinono-1,4-lactone oxidase [Ahrensia sp. 13_GOM-1096m]|uniref:D-arabinono-1,4-lactone oxidase n=1 Tax=Ahrensia sp. 13_GOM-1096m TaxID=1380380 RepID=UPI000683EB18|nr:D-arabinono-1,4-lactone oxidase [Ahrensia sp. 13_GOM-1096m]
MTWTNWSGSVVTKPEQILKPKSETALSSALAQSTGRLRVRGSGHSFTGLCATDETLISLDEMEGRVLGHRTSGEEDIVRLQAGASLNQLSKGLQKHGLAFKNLGDIDVQSLAGATMTATHGTGQNFPCLAGEMRQARLVTAQGDVIETGSDTDLLDAARASMGVLGILTEAEMSVRPAFKLHRAAKTAKLKDLMADAHDLWNTHRNFEFFVLPYCDYALSLTHEETTKPNMCEGSSDDEAALKQLRWLRNATKRFPRLRRKLLNGFVKNNKTEVEIGTSFELLANVRNTIFNEMEYHMPVQHGIDALAEVIAVIERERADVFFPIEVRKTAADTGWLSPFEGAPRISVAVHAYHTEQYDWFFKHVEPIFRRHQGRPHWGKLHSLGARDLKDLYPRFGDFQRLRSELDPKGRLINEHLAKVFDVTLA